MKGGGVIGNQYWGVVGERTKVLLTKAQAREDAASLAVFLASEDSASMTGQDINAGGGVMW